MLPFTSREDVDFFLHLEMHLRQEHPPLCGRDHLAYRSAYFPVKDVIDGDLCEQFAQASDPPTPPKGAITPAPAQCLVPRSHDCPEPCRSTRS